MQSSVAVLVLTLHVAAAVFFHELSSFDLEANVPKTNSSFGFSLGYQGGEKPKVLIGSPRYDLTGSVFQCSLDAVMAAAGTARTTKCHPATINLDAMNVTYSRNFSANQEFYLGASIAATDKYFVSCAPLRTAFLVNSSNFGVYGICFYHNDEGIARPWSGPGREKYLNDRKNSTGEIFFSDDIYGGAGWATLVDKANDRIIVAKSFYPTDAFYGKISQPEAEFESFVSNSIATFDPSTRVNSYGLAMTLGNYFNSNKDSKHYAISMTTASAQGQIQLIDSSTLTQLPGTLRGSHVGSMFGAALASADVTGDGRAELLVGAPAHAEDEACWDRGVLHIYTAQNDNQSMELMLTVLGAHDGARFATTLAANDVDGDSYAEIMVSAPYEAGEGAVYILSGYEVHVEWKQRGMASVILVSSLKRTQKIFKTKYQNFGFSLLPISDFNENGSDELLVGSPESSKVTLYRGIPSITVIVTSRISSTPVANENEYIFESCVTVRRPPKPRKITTKLSVKNVLHGNNAVFKSSGSTYEVDLTTPGVLVSNGTAEYCRDFTVVSTTSSQVTTNVALVEDIRKTKEFSNTWVTLSAQSVLEKATLLTCTCANASDCSPELTVQLEWSGNISYHVGASRSESVAIAVHNSGTKACHSCLRLRVSGAAVDHLRCDYKKTIDEYECLLPTPFLANTEKKIVLKLLMDISSSDKQLSVEVKLSKNCDVEEVLMTPLKVPYIFHGDLVTIEGSSVNYSISDIELQDRNRETLIEEQTYTIVNNKSVTWKNVMLEISVNRKPYILHMGVSARPATKCFDSYDYEFFYSHCTLDLPPNSTMVVTVFITVYKMNITNYLQDWQIIIPSELTLELSPEIVKYNKLATAIMFQKEQTLRQNITLIIIIAVIVGLLLLLIIAFILYKVGFFKRKTKQQLQDLQQEIRRQSTKRDRLASLKSQNQHEESASDMDGLVIMEESPFDDEPSPAETLADAPASTDKKTS